MLRLELEIQWLRVGKVQIRVRDPMIKSGKGSD